VAPLTGPKLAPSGPVGGGFGTVGGSIGPVGGGFGTVDGLGSGDDVDHPAGHDDDLAGFAVE
jgi:hypothetical protein